MANPVKTLHVIPSLSASEGGPTVAVYAIAAALTKQGVEVTLASTHRASAGATEGLHAHSFSRESEYYKVSLGLRHWLKASVSRFDIVHIHALFSFSSTQAARIARRANVPYVIRPLGVLNKWGLKNRRRLLKRLSLRAIELPILRSAAAIHYTTEAERMEASAACPEIGRFPSFVTPIPVEEQESKPSRDDFGRRFTEAADRRIVLFLSRLDPKKGIELLLKSFAGVKEGQANLLLVIAGGGAPSYVESLRKLADELQISKDVLWTGHLGPQNKVSAFATATVFVLPSHSENFGIAAAEALAAGVPTILSDRVALAGDAEKAGAAVVVQPEVEELRSAIAHVLANEPLRDRMSSNGAELARKLYSPEAVGAALVEQYEQILSRSRRHT